MLRTHVDYDIQAVAQHGQPHSNPLPLDFAMPQQSTFARNFRPQNRVLDKLKSRPARPINLPLSSRSLDRTALPVSDTAFLQSSPPARVNRGTSPRLANSLARPWLREVPLALVDLEGAMSHPYCDTNQDHLMHRRLPSGIRLPSRQRRLIRHPVLAKVRCIATPA